ncbi:MAG: hypothetical protein HeimC3_04700, partial [Candidatus Heimdallarchaeota archaeon LC_3]
MASTLEILLILLEILAIASFIVLLGFHIVQIQKEKVKNYFFLISIISGLLATITFLIETVSWAISPSVSTRIFLQSVTLIIYAIFFFFIYKHYEAIYSLEPLKEYKWKNYIFITLIGFQIVFFFMNYLNLIPWDFLDELYRNNLIPSFLIQKDDNGRITTYLSHVTYLIGILAYSFTIQGIIKFNLIEIRKITLSELIALILLLLTNLLVFIDDVLITTGFYSSDISLPIVVAGFFLLLLGLIFLSLSYVISNPSHMISPSLNEDFYKKLGSAFDLQDSNKIESKEILANRDQFEELEHKKLNSTSIELLIYLLNHLEGGTYAKKIESDLNLNKATVSYNLKLLEESKFIDRFESLE